MVYGSGWIFWQPAQIKKVRRVPFVEPASLKIISYKLISRILLLPCSLRTQKWLSFICPNNYLKGSICLPIGSDEQPFTACAVRRPMWHFSMQGLPSCQVTLTGRELLPHVFTLVPTSRGSYFLWHCLSPTRRGPAVHRYITLRCPDFPPSRQRRKSDNPACSNNFKEATTKINTPGIIITISLLVPSKPAFVYSRR